MKNKKSKKSKKARQKKKLRWPLAIIDIGSNSLRMVVYESPTSHKPAFNSKTNCFLGRTIDQTGKLYGRGKEKAIHTLRGFRELAQAIGVKTFFAFATAALRDAEDGKKFISKMQKTLKKRIHIISGEQEGRLSAQGVAASIPRATGIVCDLGGGSLELAVIKKGKFVRALTLPLGALRLLNNKKRIGAYIDSYLEFIPPDYPAGSPLYIIGGAFRSLGSIHAQMHGKHGKDLQNYAFSGPEMGRLSQYLKKASPQKLVTLYEIQPNRAETMACVSLLGAKLVTKLRASKVIISMHGVRDGVLMDLKRYGDLKK